MKLLRTKLKIPLVVRRVNVKYVYPTDDRISYQAKERGDKMRITPKVLQEKIAQYNEYLAMINHPWRFYNNANSGWQQLEVIRYPETSCLQIERGTSRECIDALYIAYNEMYRQACHGERITKIIEIEYFDSVIYKPDSQTVPLKDGQSVHTVIKNIMESTALWRIVYMVDGKQYTQSRETLV
jgi:hypothetical protein